MPGSESRARWREHKGEDEGEGLPPQVPQGEARELPPLGPFGGQALLRLRWRNSHPSPEPRARKRPPSFRPPSRFPFLLRVWKGQRQLRGKS